MNTLIALSGLGIFCLIAEIANLRKILVPVVVLGLLSILVATLTVWNVPGSDPVYNNMIVTTPFSVACSALFIILTAFLIAMSADFYSDKPTKFSDFIAIKVFLLTGAITMVSFGNLAMFFLGIEVLSISLYVLSASDRLNILSNEAGMKYFLLGSFASGILLFGICLVYGATGYFDLSEIYALSQGAGLNNWYPIGLTLIIIGLLFKIAAVPFHFWAPDVYEGAPTMVTATMSTLAKVAAVATLYKIVVGLNALEFPHFTIMFLIIAALSMTVGNIIALRQTNVKRMLAFSGISHAGFMLMVVFLHHHASFNLVYYMAAYSLAGIAAFSILIAVTKSAQNQDVNQFNGLAKTHPVQAIILTGALLSMAGIPIFSGFFAKFFLFTEVFQNGNRLIVIIAVINSIISMGYYFKVIQAMFTQQPVASRSSAKLYVLVGLIALLANLCIGLFPDIIRTVL
ncbi:MAG: NADH-quinone oxidoreductase subunit N [Flavobacterium sp. BFFFF2]|nr:MAG: NADH-quinone oxidoreductase subunit N [Flavobacterium sp. BFFFF2]